MKQNLVQAEVLLSSSSVCGWLCLGRLGARISTILVTVWQVWQLSWGPPHEQQAVHYSSRLSEQYKPARPVAQLELAEVQGRLRAEVAAGAEAALRVETLAALLAQAHDARATGMIWQTPQVRD